LSEKSLVEKGEDITKYLDFSHGKRTNQQQKWVNMSLPSWMIHSLDKEAERLGVTRQSIIKVWISERLKKNGIAKHATASLSSKAANGFSTRLSKNMNTIHH